MTIKLIGGFLSIGYKLINVSTNFYKNFLVLKHAFKNDEVKRGEGPIPYYSF